MSYSQTVFIESKKDKTLLQVYISSAVTKESCNEAPGIIIAHPYGPLGGNMHNNVVIAIQQHFHSKGYVTACINFRGCGKSKGRTSWTGMPEREDYISMIDYLLEESNSNLPKMNGLVLCGYSFGAMIASSIPCTTRVPCSYLLVSMPLGVLWALATTKASYFKQQPLTNTKVLSIHGDHDQFTATNKYIQWAKEKDRMEDICIPGADHFWVNYEQELINKIELWRANFSR